MHRNLKAVVLAGALLTAGCGPFSSPVPVKPAPTVPGTAPAPAARQALPALKQIEIVAGGARERLSLVEPSQGEFALEVLREKSGAWSVAEQSRGVAFKMGVGPYILERRDLPGHPGAIVAGQAPYIFAFDPSTLALLDYPKLAAPPAPGDGTQVVIDKGINILYLYKNHELVKYYHVATGRDYNGPQPTWADYKDNYVTPLGSFVVSQHVVNPVYKSYETGKVYAGGDPDSPVGTRWIGFPVLPAENGKTDTGSIWAIHGTNEPDKIGTYVSDGCIRMRVPDVEELFPQVPIGAHVTIINRFPVSK